MDTKPLTEFKVSDFNSLKMGEIIKVASDLYVRRVPGGFSFEYRKNLKESVTAAFFVSTDEFATL